MGNILGRPSYKGIVVDGGQAQIKDKPRQPTQPGVSQSSGVAGTQQTNRIDPNEYDPVVVGKLIFAKRLAPFYEGQFDDKGDGRSVGGGTSRTAADRASIMTSESTRRRNAPPTNTSNKSKKKKKQEKPSVVDATWLKTNLAECPICLLWYPRNINFTKCCKKPICTLCFVSMKRPNNANRLICCPFCRGNNLTVVYRSPERVKTVILLSIINFLDIGEGPVQERSCLRADQASEGPTTSRGPTHLLPVQHRGHRTHPHLCLSSAGTTCRQPTVYFLSAEERCNCCRVPGSHTLHVQPDEDGRGGNSGSSPGGWNHGRRAASDSDPTGDPSLRGALPNKSHPSIDARVLIK